MSSPVAVVWWAYRDGMTTALLTFTLAAVLIVLLPGPDTLVVVRNLIRNGRRTALLTVLGVLTGLVVWVSAAALGLSVVLRASHEAYDALKLTGAVYLLWLGVQSWRSRSLGEPHEPVRAGILGRGFGAGLATDLLNPKVGVFFVTFLPAFVPSGAAVVPTLLLFGAIFIVLNLAYQLPLVLLADRVGRLVSRPRVRRAMDTLTGIALVGFGIRLVTE